MRALQQSSHQRYIKMVKMFQFYEKFPTVIEDEDVGWEKKKVTKNC